MLFNSFAFAVFLPLVFALYWAVFNKKVAWRNLFLLAASYLFYGWWDWRFLSLIVISSAVDFFIGKKIAALNEQEDAATDGDRLRVRRQRRLWLAISVATNLGFLGFFKYFNFFADSLASLLSLADLTLSFTTLNIVLPVGISFYTFQTLSYTIDIYRRQLPPTKSALQFFVFVSFFPQLVAGPIERAKHLLPQFGSLYKPDYEAFKAALMLIAWGFFKKIMIADRLAVYVDSVFGNTAAAAGAPLVLGAVFFAFQLYLDFSAYSDIAIGTARLFGFDLCKNFNHPYLSASFSSFWKRWHISLSSWFQDYLYIPLGGNRRGRWRTKLNLLIVFTVSGLWHGASWNFVIWGAVNALFIICLDPLLRFAEAKNAMVRTLKSAFIFGCWAFSLIFFRAQGFQNALSYFKGISLAHMERVASFGLNATELKFSLLLLAALLVVEVVQERNANAISQKLSKQPVLLRWALYIVFVLSMVYLGAYGGGNENSFIYFQF